MNELEKSTMIAIVGEDNLVENEEGSLVIVAGGFPSILKIKEDLEALMDADAKKPELETKEEGSTVVIPYVKEFAQGNELKHAIRAWDKNYQHPLRIVVVGDREDWFGKEILHIPHERKTDNPPLDIASKMMAVIESDLVPEGFIWSNDDIYPINPVFAHDVMVFKAVGDLQKIEKFPNNLFGANMKKTIEALKKMKLPTWNYSTHTPVFFEKKLLLEVIETFNLLEDSHLIQSLYFNYHFPNVEPIMLHVDRNTWKLGVYRKDPDFKKMNSYLKNRKFFNHSRIGYIPEVQKMLSQKFKAKCQFEK